MNCPKCRTESLRRETYENIEVDRCPVCRGIFLDSGELSALLGKGLGQVADTLAFSAMSDIMDAVEAHCPKCDQLMTPSTGPSDVRVDRCEGCGAVFLDEGELATLQLHAS